MTLKTRPGASPEAVETEIGIEASILYREKLLATTPVNGFPTKSARRDLVFHGTHRIILSCRVRPI